MTALTKRPLTLNFIFCGSLALVIFLNYFSSLSNPMYFDTPLSIKPENFPQTLPSLSLFQLLNNSRYLVWYAFELNHHFFGMDGRWFRAFNLIIHVFNTFLIYGILYYLFRSIFKDKARIFHQVWAFVGALFFGINPVALYAVVYIIQRFTLVSTLFSLLSLFSYLRGLIKDKTVWFYIAVLFYFLSIHSKEHAIMMPAIFLCLTILLKKIDKKLLIQLAVPYLLFAIVGGHVIYLIKSLLAFPYEPLAKMAIPEIQDANVLAQSNLSLDSSQLYPLSIINQSWLYFRYLYLWLIPDVTRMAINLPVSFPQLFSTWPTILGPFLFVLYLIASFYLLFKRGNRGLLGFGLLYPALLFATEFSSVRVHEVFVLYRSYLWMPLLFLFMPVIFISLGKWAKWIVLSVYFVLLIIALQHRLAPFKQHISLWEDVVQKIDLTDKSITSSYRAVGNLATSLGKKNRFDESIKYFRLSLELNPNYATAWDGLGAALIFKGEYDEAIGALNKAIAISPNFKDAYYNLGTLYSQLNQHEKAAGYFIQAIHLDKNYVDALYNLGNALIRLKRFDEAITYYQRVIKLEPDQSDAHHNLGIAYASLGKLKRAVIEYQRTIQLDSNFAKAYFNFGNTLFMLNENDKALDQFKRAIQLDPNYMLAYHHAGLTLMKLKRNKEAIPYFKKALKLNPDFKPSKKMLDKIQNKPN